MSWMHCNKCFAQSNLTRSLVVYLYLGQCGHVLCSSCLSEECAICKKRLKATQICNSTPENMAMYFEDPIRLCVRVQKVYKFQLEQRSRLARHNVNTFPPALKKNHTETRAMIRLQEKLANTVQKEYHRGEKMQKYILYHDQQEQTTTGIHRQRGMGPSHRGTRRLSCLPSGQTRFQRDVKTPTISLTDSSSRTHSSSSKKSIFSAKKR